MYDCENMRHYNNSEYKRDILAANPNLKSRFVQSKLRILDQFEVPDELVYAIPWGTFRGIADCERAIRTAIMAI